MKSLLLIICLSTYLFSADNFAPDTIAPGSIARQAGPQLIAMGFDDNRYEDGVRWVVDTLLAGRLNPAGVGNKATFDGAKLKCSFFVISNADQRDAWREAYEYGCEIGNHTVTHEKAMYDEDSASHMNELGGCSKYIVNSLGLPPSHIRGFRTPFLAFHPTGLTFQTIKNLGMRFDASVENGTQSSAILWTRPYYPWTLDYNIGAIGGATPTVGLWEIPHVNYIKSTEPAPANKGFDSGLWPATSPGLNLSGPEALKYFKGTLDFHYGTRKVKYSWEADSSSVGMRAPMDMGFHSDYYSVVASDPNNPDHNPDFVNLKSTVQERRQALSDFVDYALTFDDVRFVTMSDVIKWMNHPAALDDISQNQLYDYTDSIVSDNILSFSEISVAEATGSSISANTDVVGKILATTTVDNTGNYVPNRQVDLVVSPGENFAGVDGITVTYKSTIPLRITFEQSDLQLDESSHFFAVPTSTDFRTVTMVVNDLNIEKPYWSVSTNSFDLSKVDRLSISPMASDSIVEGEFEITNIQLYGSKNFNDDPSAIETSTASTIPNISASLNGLYHGNLNLTIKESGNYKVEVFTPSGRTITSKTVQLSTGNRLVSVGSLVSGTYLTRISGMGISESKLLIKD